MPTPNAERSHATRSRLLEATVDCLAEVGFVGTTTTLVAQRAGVSRGAQLHHYPTRTELVVAAIGHLAARRAREMAHAAAGLPDGTDRVAAVLDLLARQHTGPLFAAALEVWVAARSDEALRDALLPVETNLGREMHRLTLQMLGADESRPGVREAVQATLDLIRGLGLANLLSDDSSRRGPLLTAWASTLRGVLG